MNISVATKKPSSVKLDENCTSFQLHKSQHTLMNGLGRRISDYTEHRLLKYAEKVTDPQQKMVIMAMLSDYVSGNIAVAWKRGNPIYVRVTKDATSK
jgi:DNA-directed RNA polymerase subunit L